MLTSNRQEVRDTFALTLATEFGVSLKDLQRALERSAEADLTLDLALLEMKLVSEASLASAAAAADYVLRAERPAALVSTNGARQFKRQAQRLKVEFEEWGPLKVAYTNNISRGGICVSLPEAVEAPAVDTLIDLSLCLPDARSLQLKGRVCYCVSGPEGHHVGIEIHYQHTTELMKIDDLLRKNAA